MEEYERERVVERMVNGAILSAGRFSSAVEEAGGVTGWHRAIVSRAESDRCDTVD